MAKSSIDKIAELEQEIAELRKSAKVEAKTTWASKRAEVVDQIKELNKLAELAGKESYVLAVADERQQKVRAPKMTKVQMQEAIEKMRGVLRTKMSLRELVDKMGLPEVSVRNVMKKLKREIEKHPGAQKKDMKYSLKK